MTAYSDKHAIKTGTAIFYLSAAIGDISHTSAGHTITTTRAEISRCRRTIALALTALDEAEAALTATTEEAA